MTVWEFVYVRRCTQFSRCASTDLNLRQAGGEKTQRTRESDRDREAMHLCEVLTDGDGLTSRIRLRSRASLGLSVPSRCTQIYQRGRKLQLRFSLVVKESFIKAISI